MTLAARVILGKIETALVKRLEALHARLEAGDDTVWPDLSDAAGALASIAPATAPGGNGEMLTTWAMAERLGLKPKTLLKHAAAGKIRPAVRQGKLYRWSGRESL